MKTMICTRCKDYGRPAKKKRGSDTIALLAWFVFPFGVPYTIWRISSKVPVCRQCGSMELVDSESPVGLRLMATLIGELPKDDGPSISQPSTSNATEPPVDKNQMDLLNDVPQLETATIPTLDETIDAGTGHEPTEDAPTNSKRKNPDVW